MLYDCDYCSGTFTGPPRSLTVADYPVPAASLTNGVTEPEETSGGMTLCPVCAKAESCVACGMFNGPETGTQYGDGTVVCVDCEPAYKTSLPEYANVKQAAVGNYQKEVGRVGVYGAYTFTYDGATYSATAKGPGNYTVKHVLRGLKMSGPVATFTVRLIVG